MDLLAYAALVVLAVAAIILAVAAGVGLLNRTPLRRPPHTPAPQNDDDHPRGQ
ncbi:hypothetical protein [Plantactinospora sp. GCM10030261]|uniref:hypothetical protein n=1 Tax=Plantactinospora sp. GCM10030261 TaxID=3273420 RepID=UPI003618219D